MSRNTCVCVLVFLLAFVCFADPDEGHKHEVETATPAAYRQEFARLAADLKGDSSWKALDRLRSLRLALGPSWYKEFPSLRNALGAGITMAAARGDRDLVSDAAASGADANVSDAGYTPLFWAAYRLDSDMVRTLLEVGADPNVPNKYEMMPIVEPVWQGDPDLVKLLVANGADPDSRGKTGAHIVFDAVASGNGDMLKLLVKLGADINEGLSSEGAPILWRPIADGDAAMVATLIEAGADVNASFKGRTLSWHARKMGHASIYRTLRKAGGKT